MDKFLIVKTGGTFEGITKDRGDFEHWTASGMGLDSDEWQCVNAQAGEELPDPAAFAGCVITGSHDMVTDNTDWIQSTKSWVSEAVETGLPMLGICFGHQIMADALGGQADYHPDGLEIGTVDITLKNSVSDDPLFASLPDTFVAHVTHSQSAVELPPGAVLLASSDHEAHQAFRVGRHAWGVQFHPEFDVDATKYYIDMLREKIAGQGGDADTLSQGVVETPESSGVLTRFVEYCREL